MVVIPSWLNKAVTCPKFTGRQGEAQQQNRGGVAGFRATRRATRLSGSPPHAEPAPSRQMSAQGSMPRGQKPQGHPVPARDRSQVTDSFDDTTGGPGPSTRRERRQPTRGTGPSCLLCIWFPPSGPCQGLLGLHFFDLMVKALRSIILCFAWQCRRTYL